MHERLVVHALIGAYAEGGSRGEFRVQKCSKPFITGHNNKMKGYNKCPKMDPLQKDTAARMDSCSALLII